MAVEFKDWYKNWFGNEYLTVYSHRDTNEARKLIRFILSRVHIPKNARILDLCCGQGRHALILDEAGYRVIGADLSRTLLEIAKFSSSDRRCTFFVQADMRSLPFSEHFDLLLNLFTSFGYFETDHENLQVFREFNHVLKPGGYFVFDYFNAEHVALNLVDHQRDELDDLTVIQQREIQNQRVNKKITLRKNGSEKIFYESVKMYWPDKILRMLDDAGLTVKNMYGNYAGQAFDIRNSPRLLIVGKKDSRGK